MEIKLVTKQLANKYNMSKIDYPKNMEYKVKIWLEKEGFPKWVEHKEKYNYQETKIEHLTIQFILERLDMLGERCKDNPIMFMGNTVKMLFGIKALHVADLISNCCKYGHSGQHYTLHFWTPENDLITFRKRNIGIELGCIYTYPLTHPKYFISKKLSDYVLSQLKEQSGYTEDAVMNKKFSLEELSTIFNNIIADNKETYYDKTDENAYCNQTILADEKLEELFQVKAIERRSLEVYLARHLFTQQNVMTKTSEKQKKYIFEDHIKGTANDIAIESLHQIKGDAKQDYTFYPGIKYPILNLWENAPVVEAWL